MMSSDTESWDSVIWYRVRGLCHLIQSLWIMSSDTVSGDDVIWYRVRRWCHLIQNQEIMSSDTASGDDVIRYRVRRWCHLIQSQGIVIWYRVKKWCHLIQSQGVVSSGPEPGDSVYMEIWDCVFIWWCTCQTMAMRLLYRFLIWMSDCLQLCVCACMCVWMIYVLSLCRVCLRTDACMLEYKLACKTMKSTHARTHARTHTHTHTHTHTFLAWKLCMHKFIYCIFYKVVFANAFRKVLFFK